MDSYKELLNQLNSTMESLQKIRIEVALGKEKNVQLIGRTKRQIARLLTKINQLAIKSAISQRLTKENHA